MRINRENRARNNLSQESSQVSLHFNPRKEHSNRSSECLRRFRRVKSATRIDTLSDTERIKGFAELWLKCLEQPERFFSILSKVHKLRD